MNYMKLNCMLSVIKDEGDLPRDRWGEILGCEDMVAWFGLNECLSPKELDYMKRRLAEFVESQRAIELMKLPHL